MDRAIAHAPCEVEPRGEGESVAGRERSLGACTHSTGGARDHSWGLKTLGVTGLNSDIKRIFYLSNNFSHNFVW